MTRFLLLAPLCLALAVPAHARNVVVNLQTADGHFLKALDGGGGGVVTDAKVAQTWEKFTIVDANGGKLVNGDSVILRTLNGHYLCADRNKNLLVVADRGEAREWERFTIHKLNSEGEIKDGSTVAFSVNQGGAITYFSALNGGGGELRATATRVQAPEKFKLKLVSGTPDTIKLSAPFASPQAFSKPIGFDHDRSPGRNAADCRNYFGIGFPGCYDNHEGTDFMLYGHEPAMDRGFEVVAAAPGFVVKTADGFTDRCHFDPTVADNITCPGTQSEDANYVGIRHDDGHIAYYYHLKRGSVTVHEGDRVECGQKLGQVGSSGRSSAPHLHFQIHRRMSVDQEAATTDYSSPNVSAITPFFDPYSDDMWAFRQNDIPNKTCGAPNPTFAAPPGWPPMPPVITPPPTCTEDRTKVQCDPASYWAVCAPAKDNLGGACVQPVFMGCAKTCADYCKVVHETVVVPCHP